MKLLGKSPLHVAIADGQVNVLKTLLQYTSNVDVVSAIPDIKSNENYLIVVHILQGDTDGDTPLHTCAHQ